MGEYMDHSLEVIKMKLSYLLLSLCMLAATSQAADEMEPLVITAPGSAATMQAVPYSYGMKLDIDEVISIHEPDEMTCDVITATMIYEDSSDTRRALSYLKVPSSCSHWG